MTNFTDIFKKSFLQEAGSLSTSDFLLSMLCAFLCGMVLYFIYRRFFKGVIYNNNFNILLMITTMVTCFAVIVISSNVVLSLGMVGALSIVRFRAAIKDPLDVGFLFWAVAIGITSGAGLYIISILGTLFVSAVYILLVSIRNKKRVYLLIIKHRTEAFSGVSQVVNIFAPILKNRTTVKDYTELTYEIRLKNDDTSFVNDLLKVDGVESAIIVEFTGDYCE